MGGTAIKHPVPDRIKPLFVIFDIRALWRCTHMATVGVKWLIYSQCIMNKSVVYRPISNHK